MDCDTGFVFIMIVEVECPDIPVIVKVNDTICIGESVDLNDLILAASENIEMVEFYSDSNYLNLLIPAETSVEGWYYVKAYNKYECYVEDSVHVTVSPLTVGGTIAIDQTLCSGGTPDTLRLSSNVGTVVRWEYSDDNFVSDLHVIDNTTTTLPSEEMEPLYANRHYRAVVKSGACEHAFSDTVLITIISKPVLSGAVAVPDSICESKTSVLSSSRTGGEGIPTYQWQYYNGTAWADVADGTPHNAIYEDDDTEELIVSNILIPGNYSYRLTVAMAAGCNAESDSVVLTVFAAPNEGEIKAESTMVCYNTSTTLTLDDYSGPIRWQKSTTSATTGFSDIPGATNPTLVTGNLTQTTWFRVAITNVVCGNVVSDAVEIKIAPNPAIILISDPATTTQTLRQPNPIEDIVYSIVGAVDIVVTGLPEGITATVTGNILTISGTPLEIGTFDYEITISSDCGEAMAAGVMVVKQACPVEKLDEVNDETYRVIELVGFCWYRDNVRGTLYQDSTYIPFAQPYYHYLYPDKEQNALNFGLLYTYDDVMGGELCPEGWRMPTLEEWQLLNAYHINDLRNPDYWLQPNNNTNNTLFDARGAGFYNSTLQRFESLYGYTAWWSADASINTTTNTLLGTIMRYYCDDLEIGEIKATDAISVRCLFDD